MEPTQPIKPINTQDRAVSHAVSQILLAEFERDLELPSMEEKDS